MYKSSFSDIFFGITSKPLRCPWEKYVCKFGWRKGGVPTQIKGGGGGGFIYHTKVNKWLINIHFWKYAKENLYFKVLEASKPLRNFKMRKNSYFQIVAAYDFFGQTL